MKRKVVFAISKISGGGAERVMIQLANYILKHGYDVEILVTNQSKQSINREDLCQGVDVYCIEDYIASRNTMKITRKLTGIVCRCFERISRPVPDVFAWQSFKNVYGLHIDATMEYLKQRHDAKIIAFLQPTIEIMMVACRITGNKLIISERMDPVMFFRTRYASFFLKNYYPYVEGIVFQTGDARAAYPKILQEKSDIILNPIQSSLPQRYVGVRKKKIVNFCRLSAEKNLFLLIDAFEVFYKSHTDYSLEIYGNGKLRNEIVAYAQEKSCSSAILVLPHRQQLHLQIRDYAMFVSSSNHEGMSNSMLEAMAIGLPTICTDCPIGGAKTVIKDGVNGLLVPIQDRDALVEAMCKIADHPDYADELSMNAQKIRHEQSIEIIGRKWMTCIEKI